MLDGLLWVITNIGMAFYNFGYALTHPGSWLNWSDPQSLVRFIYYGGSVEFFFVVFTTFLILTAVGFWKRNFLWAMVRGLEGFANGEKDCAGESEEGGLGRGGVWACLRRREETVVVLVGSAERSKSGHT